MFSEKCLKLSDLRSTPRVTVLLCDRRQVPSPLWSSVGGFGLIFCLKEPKLAGARTLGCRLAPLDHAKSHTPVLTIRLGGGWRMGCLDFWSAGNMSC